MHYISTRFCVCKSLLAVFLGGCTLCANAQEAPLARLTQSRPDSPAPAAARSLTDELNELSRRHRVVFLYRSDRLADKPVPSQPAAANASLEEALHHLLALADLSFRKLDAGHYAIVRKKNERPGRTTAPERTGSFVPLPEARASGNAGVPVALSITGTVRNENNEGIPGASILLKGTSLGTATDNQGQYTLSIGDDQGNGTLVVSFIGYVTEEIPIGGRSSVDINLVPDIASLSEVVVVGYGTQQRKDVTGAIASVTTKDFRDMPITNIGQALQGRMAGVQVQQTSGAPGSSPAIRVRGIGSITAGSSPLLVVDQQILGGLNDLGFINPNDIERIDVLKDASATAIYGARGSNGVVIITTKRGKANEPRVNVDYYTGFQDVTKRVDMLSTAEAVALGKEAYANSGVTPAAGIAALYARTDLPNVDYQNLIFQTAPINSYQASATGGTDKLTYLVSGNYISQDGVVKTSQFRRFSVRANLDAQITKRLKVGLGLNPSLNNERIAQTDGHWQNFGTINAALTTFPFVSVYQADGVTYNSQQQYNNPQFNLNGVTNPLANLTGITDRQKTTRMLGNLYAELDVIEGLKYRASIGVDMQQQRRNYFQNSTVPLNGQLPPLPAVRVVGMARSQQNLNWIFNQTLTYVRSINNTHNLNFLLGTEAQRNDFENTAMLANNFPNDVVTTLNAGTILASNAGVTLPFNTPGPGAFATQSSFASYFARAGYNFLNKYLFDVSFRVDGSSRFAAGSRFASFPAAAIGWRVSEENFLKDNRVVSNLKIRASYGRTGNAALPSDYGAFGQLTYNNYNFNNALALGLRPATPQNPNLTWEKSEQADIGLELGLLNDRIFFTADAYDRITKDLLLNVAVPALTGYTNALQNIGKVRNRGLEFGITSENTTGALRWSTSANISFNRNTVLALGPAGDPIFSNVPGVIGSGTITRIGQPLASFYGYQFVGIFQNQAEIDAYAKYDGSQPKPGDRKMADINGDKRITIADRTDIGSNQPDYTWALTNNLSFKGFDFAVMLQGVQGAEILNFTRRFFNNQQAGANQLGEVRDRWRSESQPGNGRTPRAATSTTGLNNQVSSAWIEDGSYLNIRNITLGYTLPTALVGKAFLRGARLYAGVQNAFIFTDYTFYNPEVSGFENADPLTIGVDYGTFPQARTVTFGVQLGL